jgi:3-oxoacyl-[acyl-carrier-protein] synthase III
VAALDFTPACSGFVYGTNLARALIVSGPARHVLLVTADAHSKWIHLVTAEGALSSSDSGLDSRGVTV